MKKDLSVLAIGEILFDVLNNDKKPGGSSMNVALHLHKQGIKTHFISAVGNDENGKELIHYLKNQNFDTKYIQHHLILPTSTVNVNLDKNLQASYVINQPVAWDEITFNNEGIELAKNSSAMVYCSLTCRNKISRNTIFKLLNHAKLKVFDINLRRPHYDLETIKYLLAKADILKINEDEMAYLKESFNIEGDENDILKVVSNLYNINIICLTLGEKGAKVFHEGKFYNHVGYKIKVADTVGAGDAFLATFIAGYLKKLTIPDILNNACKVGAFVASKSGANPDYDFESLTAK